MWLLRVCNLLSFLITDEGFSILLVITGYSSVKEGKNEITIKYELVSFCLTIREWFFYTNSFRQ